MAIACEKSNSEREVIEREGREGGESEREKS